LPRQNFTHFGTTEDVNVPDIPGNPISEPASLLLLGTGLLGIAAKVKRRKKDFEIK
jgi:PEP-CTERM putative exosortase interaction domain